MATLTNIIVIYLAGSFILIAAVFWVDFVEI